MLFCLPGMDVRFSKPSRSVANDPAEPACGPQLHWFSACFTDVTHSSPVNPHVPDGQRTVRTIHFMSFMIAFFGLSCYGFATKVFVSGPLHKLRD
jgi:hypothetical protein